MQTIPTDIWEQFSAVLEKRAVKFIKCDPVGVELILLIPMAVGKALIALERKSCTKSLKVS